MTRFLSELLRAPEPFFRHGLQKLEAANGHPAADIRFSTEVSHATRQKIQELGLDPDDTTPAELYHALQERMKTDDTRLERTLRVRAATHVSAEADAIDGMVHALQELPDSRQCFALKPSALKSLLKKTPPKKALKQLGYRSLDSFLKHEAPVSALSAAWLSEDASWQRRFVNQYKQLKATDFETRRVSITHLKSQRWQTLASQVVADNKHNILAFKELGALVFLPLPAEVPAGSTTASLSLALHQLNEIRAASSFLKLCQVRPDFGKIVQTVARDEPSLNSKLLDQAVPWHIIQRYYARLTHRSGEEVFEPHLQLEDMAWRPVEKTLSAIEPSLAFWHHSAHLGMLHDRGPVSLNIADAALNACNNLPFEKRLSHYFQQSLWHELLLRYLRRDTVERAVIGELQPELAEERVIA